MKDLTGQRFGRLVALEPTDRRNRQLVVWRCRCDCGNTCEVPSASLVKGNTRSCGCLGRERARDIAGERFGRLVAREPTDKRVRGSVVWLCDCDCGNSYEAPSGMLRSGQVRSCGCMRGRGPSKDLSGQRFGALTAVRCSGRKGRYLLWECRCDCGAVVEATTNQLTSGKKKRCSRDCPLTGTKRSAKVAPAPSAVSAAAHAPSTASTPEPSAVDAPEPLTTAAPAPKPNSRSKDITCVRFGRLIAVNPTERREHGYVVWRCLCDCNRVVYVSSRQLTTGSKTSCDACEP